MKMEGPPKKESPPDISGVDLFERLVNTGTWNEVVLEEIFETHPEDLYMLYLNYTESGLWTELPEHERKMYDWLAARFESDG